MGLRVCGNVGPLVCALVGYLGPWARCQTFAHAGSVLLGSIPRPDARHQAKCVLWVYGSTCGSGDLRVCGYIVTRNIMKYM